VQGATLQRTASRTVALLGGAVTPLPLQATDEMQLLVLASGRRSTVGVDLASGTLLRTHHPAVPERLERFSIASATIAHWQQQRPEQPESVDFVDSPSQTGRLVGWKADRVLRQLLHPRGRYLLGAQGPTVPCWMLDGNRPSVSIVEPETPLTVIVSERGVRARFGWNRHWVEAPLEDPEVLARLDWLPNSPLQGRALTSALGFRPDRMVLAWSRPRSGHCYRVVAGLLPRHSGVLF
jgi:hypothetical protein